MENSQVSTQPNKIKFWKKSQFTLFLLCLLITGQSMVVTGQLIITMTIIQKVYGYSSFQMAFKNVIYNIFFASFSVIIGSFSVKNKLCWIGVGGFIISIGCLIIIIPHFKLMNSNNNLIFNTIQNQSKNSLFKLCLSDILINTKISSKYCISSNIQYFIIFCISHAIFGIFIIIFILFLGIGSSFIFTLVVTYFDEITNPIKAGFYLAIFNIFGVIGPAFGFGFGKVFLSVPINLDWKQFYNITPKSENWIGAWWLGYIFPGIFLCLVSLFLILISLNFKFKNSSCNNSISANHHVQILSNKSSFIILEKNKLHTIKLNLNKFLFICKNIFSNFPFMTITFAALFDVIPLNGYISFLSKIIEVQFRYDTATVIIIKYF